MTGKDKELITMVKKIEKLSKDPNIVKYISEETIEKIGKNMCLKETEEKSKKKLLKNYFKKIWI